jgi:adenine-specific DNA-methyltransferase
VLGTEFGRFTAPPCSDRLLDPPGTTDGYTPCRFNEEDSGEELKETDGSMKPLTANDPETKTSDILAENVEQLKSLFPEAFTEGKVDFEVLKQLLGGAVEEREEKYGLNWHGKRRARRLALTPSAGTLRPCPEDSVGWDTTKNLMIEGDNFEVLKLLQKSYAGKVKLIYIDPPYNTDRR